MQKCMYNGEFEGNTLIVGATDYWKTSFVERLAVNIVFGKLTKAEWISQKTLNRERHKFNQTLIVLLVFTIQKYRGSYSL